MSKLSRPPSSLWKTFQNGLSDRLQLPNDGTASTRSSDLSRGERSRRIRVCKLELVQNTPIGLYVHPIPVGLSSPHLPALSPVLWPLD